MLHGREEVVSVLLLLDKGRNVKQKENRGADGLLFGVGATLVIAHSLGRHEVYPYK